MTQSVANSGLSKGVIATVPLEPGGLLGYSLSVENHRQQSLDRTDEDRQNI